MSKKKKIITPEEKIAILKRHLLEKVQVSDLYDQYRLYLTVFYCYQKELFENGALGFQNWKDNGATH